MAVAGAAALAMLAAGCDKFSLTSVLNGELGRPLSIEPSSLVLPAAEQVTFKADGGVPPYRFSLHSGGGSVDEASGLYTAPLTAGTAVVRVIDSAGAAKDATLTISDFQGPLTIGPSAISVSVGETVEFVAVGGTSPYTFSISLPPGSGSPSIDPATGVYTAGSTPGTDTVTVTDAAAASVTATVTVTATTLPDIDYTVTSVSHSAGTTAGQTVSGTLTVQNAGTVNGTQAVSWYVFASTDTVLDGSDYYVAGGSTPALNAGASSAPIAFSGLWPSTPASYYLIAQLSAPDDASTANNSGCTAAAVAVMGAPPANVDYSVPLVSNTGGTTTGGALAGSFTVTNGGADGGGATIYWTVYRSTNAVLDVGIDPVVDSGTLPALATGATSSPVAFSGTWPSGAGTYYLIAGVSASDDVNAANNATASAAATVSPPDIDYAVSGVSSTGGTDAGRALAGSFTVQNAGTAAGAQTVFWTAYLSSDAVLNSGVDPVLDSGSFAALAASASTSPTFGGTWPAAAGTYYLIVQIYASDDVNSGNDTIASAPVTTNPANVDYTVTSVVNSGGTTAGGTLSGSFTVQNGGTAAGAETVHWSVYVSADTLLDGTDMLADTGSTAALGAGASSSPSFSGTWPTTAGGYYLIAQVSAGDDVNAANDAAASTLVSTSGSPPPNVDYLIPAVSNTGGTTSGQPLSASFTVQNIGSSAGTAAVYWTAYRSTDAALDVPGDAVIDSGSLSALAAGATSAAMGINGTWPSSTGTYYLIVKLSASDDVNAGNDSTASGAIAVTAPDVDCSVTAVSSTGGSTTGGPLAGTFTVQNIGTAAGVATVYWTAYLSADANLNVGIDPVVDSGSVAALTAGASAGPTFSGTWPSTPGSYYLIVRVVASDDIASANDTKASAAVSVTAPNVDYTVPTVSNSGGTTAGQALSGSFTVQNAGTASGASPVYWTAYLSADALLDGADAVIDSGSLSALAAGATSAPVGISGTWPAGGGTYYLIVGLSASDDVNAGNDTTASSPITVTVPNVDYLVTVVNNSGGTVTDGAIAGNFTLQNAGTAGGAQAVYWTAYVSSNTTLEIGTDAVIDSGSTTALAAGTSLAGVSFTGTWPATPATYYLLVKVSAGDDVNAGNDLTASAAVSVTAPVAQPNYDIASLTVQPRGTPGALYSAAGPHSFRIQEVAGNAGTQPIDWRVYRSLDVVLDGADVLADSGVTAALGAGAFTDISFDGTWPAGVGSFYYLIVRLTASDDSDPIDDMEISSRVAVPISYTEGTEDNSDSGPTPPAFSAVGDYGITLELGSLVEIVGTMDTVNQFDTFRFTAGTGVNGLEMQAEWSTGFDDIDLYLWNESGGEVTSVATSADSEPANPPLRVTGIVPGNLYYAGVKFYLAGGTSGSTGLPYRLYLVGRP